MTGELVEARSGLLETAGGAPTMPSLIGAEVESGHGVGVRSCSVRGRLVPFPHGETTAHRVCWCSVPRHLTRRRAGGHLRRQK